MHIEILTEDSSGAALLELIVPMVLGGLGEHHTWRIHSYRGIGRLPKGLTANSDPSKRVLLDQLPRILSGYGKTPGIDAVIVVVDTDIRDCKQMLAELTAAAVAAGRADTIFRLAIEEIEAWYLGDRAAVLQAYPRARKDVLDRYNQDTVCGTWELLADAVHPGGVNAVKASGWPLPGQLNHEWAAKIGPEMKLTGNASPSFNKLVEALSRLAAA